MTIFERVVMNGHFVVMIAEANSQILPRHRRYGPSSLGGSRAVRNLLGIASSEKRLQRYWRLLDGVV